MVHEDINIKLKKIDDSLKERIIEKMFDYLKVDRRTVRNTDLMLSWEQVKELDELGVVYFSSHTMSHSILTRIPRKRAEYKIQQSKRLIDQKLGRCIQFFSYPNGRYGDFNDEITKIVRECGYAAEFITINKGNNDIASPFTLNRDGPLHMFGLNMAGVFELIKNWVTK